MHLRTSSVASTCLKLSIDIKSTLLVKHQQGTANSHKKWNTGRQEFRCRLILLVMRVQEVLYELHL
jgi:hypothetical protein